MSREVSSDQPASQKPPRPLVDVPHIAWEATNRLAEVYTYKAKFRGLATVAGAGATAYLAAIDQGTSAVFAGAATAIGAELTYFAIKQMKRWDRVNKQIEEDRFFNGVVYEAKVKEPGWQSAFKNDNSSAT